jgi:hypothetical protein
MHLEIAEHRMESWLCIQLPNPVEVEQDGNALPHIAWIVNLAALSITGWYYNHIPNTGAEGVVVQGAMSSSPWIHQPRWDGLILGCRYMACLSFRRCWYNTVRPYKNLCDAGVYSEIMGEVKTIKHYISRPGWDRFIAHCRYASIRQWWSLSTS